MLTSVVFQTSNSIIVLHCSGSETRFNIRICYSIEIKKTSTVHHPWTAAVELDRNEYHENLGKVIGTFPSHLKPFSFFDGVPEVEEV